MNAGEHRVTYEHGRELDSILLGISPERKPKALLDPFDIPEFDTFTDLPFIPGLRQAAIIDLERRHGDIIRQLQQQSNTDEEFERHYNEFLRRAKYSEIAERIVNGVKVEFTERLDLSGRRIQNTFDDPQHPDHGRPHVRRVENLSHWETLVYPNFQYEGLREFLSVALFSEFHDKAQIPALIWNKDRVKDQHIKIKAGHAEEGGILVEMLEESIAHQGHMSEALAREAAEFASILIFIHDVPEKMISKLKGTVHANWREGDMLRSLPEEELFAHYVAGDLSMFTTSPAQRISIMRHIKGLKGVMIKSRRDWGLDPEIEKVYHDKLFKLSNDTIPTYLEVPPRVIECAIDAATISLIADMKDMMSPVHAHVRKFKVDASKTRNVYLMDEATYDRITGEIGDDTQSDYERAMWEIFEFIRIVKKSRLWDVEEISDILINTALQSFADTHWFFSELMRGEAGFGVIRESYAERIYQVGVKALKNAGMPREALESIKAALAREQDPIFLKAFFNERLVVMDREKYPKAEKYLRRFGNRAEAIQIESEDAVVLNREKLNADDGLAHTYSEAEMTHVQVIRDRLFTKLCELSEISSDEGISRLSRKKLKTLTIGGYDSIGGVADMKTLIPLTEKQEQMLDELDL